MISYRVIGNNEPQETLDSIASLFREMYEFMQDKGMQLSIVQGGEQKWISTASRLPGKMNHIVVAEDENIVGFAHGNIRLAPDHFGGVKTGFISHVYVQEGYREQGIASKLADMLIESLKAAGARHFELEVLVMNQQAINFWQKKGFKKELYRMSKSSV